MSPPPAPLPHCPTASLPRNVVCRWVGDVVTGMQFPQHGDPATTIGALGRFLAFYGFADLDCIYAWVGGRPFGSIYSKSSFVVRRTSSAA